MSRIAGIAAALFAVMGCLAAVPPPDGPSRLLKCIPSRFGAIYYPGERPAFTLTEIRHDKSSVADPAEIDCRITDWLGNELCRRRVVDGRFDVGEELGGRLGAFALDAVTADGTCSNRTWFACLASTNVNPCPWIGTQCHFLTWGWGRDMRYVALLAAAGIGVVRVDFLWSVCEKTKGVYNPPRDFDGFVDALLSHGITMNMILDYDNKIYDNPVDQVAFARFAAWTAEHFKGRVCHFEIWNEPQNFCFKKRYWKDGEDDTAWIRKFTEFTHAADDAIRQVNPDAIVGVTSEDLPDLLRIMLKSGIARPHNAVAFHPYCHGQHRPEREYFLKDFGAEFRALARANGGANRWHITEAGWTTYEGVGEYWKVAGCYPRASYAGQAMCIVRMYLAALEAGCDYACQYDFRDDGLRREYTEHNFGLVHHDYTPKPSFAAVAFLTRHVGRRRYVCDLSAEKERYRVAAFDPELGAKDGRVLVLWSVEGEYEWTVPQSCGPLAECRDLMGNVMAPPVVGDRRLKLTECPIYIKLGTPL